jgi:peptide methionine sulfoxide reductase MsrA
MTTATSKIGLGGGCNWCTEGVFESLVGIQPKLKLLLARFNRHVDQQKIAKVGLKL